MAPRAASAEGPKRAQGLTEARASSTGSGGPSGPGHVPTYHLAGIFPATPHPVPSNTLSPATSHCSWDPGAAPRPRGMPSLPPPPPPTLSGASSGAVSPSVCSAVKHPHPTRFLASTPWLHMPDPLPRRHHLPPPARRPAPAPPAHSLQRVSETSQQDPCPPRTPAGWVGVVVRHVVLRAVGRAQAPPCRTAPRDGTEAVHQLQLQLTGVCPPPGHQAGRLGVLLRKPQEAGGRKHTAGVLGHGALAWTLTSHGGTHVHLGPGPPGS